MLSHALLQQVLRALDLLGCPRDGDDSLRGPGHRLVDGDHGAAVNPDLPDPLSSRPDDGSGELIGDCHLQ